MFKSLWLVAFNYVIFNLYLYLYIIIIYAKEDYLLFFVFFKFIELRVFCPNIKKNNRFDKLLVDKKIKK